MISATMDGLLVTLVVTLLLEVFRGRVFGVARRGQRRRPTPAVAVGLIVGVGVMAGLGGGGYDGLEEGPPLAMWVVLLGSLLVFGMCHGTDGGVPSSRRHFVGTVGGALLLALGGLRMPYIGIYGGGAVELGVLPSVLLTVAWVFVFVGTVEICAMLPMLAPLVAMVVGGLTLLPIGFTETYPSQALSGVLMGGVLGRFLGEFQRGMSRPPEKSEIMVLGYVASAVTLVTFVKSLALAGFILPIGLLTLFAIVLAMYGFERSIMLRSAPRGSEKEFPL